MFCSRVVSAPNRLVMEAAIIPTSRQAISKHMCYNVRMRKIITTTFVTLDGVMQAPGGPEEDASGGFKYGGWQAHVLDDSLGEALNELVKPPFAMLLGRTTYNIFAGFWPKQDP